jgi:hypothetical protein
MNPCGHSPYVTSSLTRGWVGRLQLLLDLASTVIIASDSPAGFMTMFYCLSFKTAQTWKAMSPFYMASETGCPVINPGSGFHFRRLLGLAGLRWMYWNPPPNGKTASASLGSSLYSLKEDPTENTPVSIITLLLLAFRFRGNVFTEPMLRKGLHNPVVLLLRALPSNGGCSQSHRLSTVLHVTIHSLSEDIEHETVTVNVIFPAKP